MSLHILGSHIFEVEDDLDELNKQQLLATSRMSHYLSLYSRYQTFTMVRVSEFVANLQLIENAITQHDLNAGCIIECGTWRGGMAAAMVHLLGSDRSYHFFDSFQGLPLVTEEDGAEALGWQQNTTGPRYFNNCTADRSEFNSVMDLIPFTYSFVQVHEGWFEDTFLKAATGPIAVLRLDADWYRSTKICLENFWPRLLPGALVIIDDYYCWQGCRRAVHEYLHRVEATEAIERTCLGGVAYIVKR